MKTSFQKKFFQEGIVLVLTVSLIVSQMFVYNAFGMETSDQDAYYDESDYAGEDENQDCDDGTQDDEDEYDDSNDWDDEDGDDSENRDDEDGNDNSEDLDDEDGDGDSEDRDDEDGDDSDDWDDEDGDDNSDDWDDEDGDDDSDDWDDEDGDDDSDDWDDEDGDDDSEDWDDEIFYMVYFIDGDDIISEQEVTEGEGAEVPELEKEGYDLSWSEDFDSVYEDMEIYAVWTPKQYSVTLNANGGKLSKKKISVTYGEKYGELPTPTKKNFQFDGWYTDKKGGEVVTGKTVYTSAANQTIYAHWKSVKVKKVTLKSVKSKKNVMNLNIKKVKGAAGYEVTYSTDKKFKKGAKTVEFTGTKTSVKKLKTGKTYYVKVRAYAKDSSGSNVYGSYSKIIKVKVAKK